MRDIILMFTVRYPQFNEAGKQNLISWFKTFAVFWMLYASFWVIPRRLNFICWPFGSLCLLHLHRQVGAECIYLPMKMEQTECTETSANKIQTPRNYPEESIKQDRQCTYYVILQCVLVTIVGMEEQQCFFCVLLSYMSLSTIRKYWVLHKYWFHGLFVSLATIQLPCKNARF